MRQFLVLLCNITQLFYCKESKSLFSTWKGVRWVNNIRVASGPCAVELDLILVGL